jgi:transcriptional regulator with XRE-family HTH domain
MTDQGFLGLQDVLARALRRIREERGWSQDELTRRAGRLGLRWSRVTLADIEAGRRDVTVEEFCLLPLLLDVELPELLPKPESKVRVGAGDVEVGALLLVLGGRAHRVSPNQVSALHHVGGISVEYDDPKRARKARRIARLRANDPSAELSIEVLSHAEAERHAAEVLGLDPLDVVDISHGLWGRSLSEERNRRVEERAGTGDLARRRGHVTRRLIRELEEELKRTRGKKR